MRTRRGRAKTGGAVATAEAVALRGVALRAVALRADALRAAARRAASQQSAAQHAPAPPAARPAARPAVALPRAFYERSTLVVARELLGKVLVHRTARGVASGIIVETEAYIGEDDPACHAAPGPTKRNEPLYGVSGFAYVYLNYGIHYLVNVVTEAEGSPAAVLIRALEPLDGIPLMRERRSPNGSHVAVADLCHGPGNLTKALGITISDNRRDLTASLDGKLYVEDRGHRPAQVTCGPRIGIKVAVDRPWRFWITGNTSVSGSRKRA